MDGPRELSVDPGRGRHEAVRALALRDIVVVRARRGAAHDVRVTGPLKHEPACDGVDAARPEHEGAGRRERRRADVTRAVVRPGPAVVVCRVEDEIRPVERHRDAGRRIPKASYRRPTRRRSACHPRRSDARSDVRRRSSTWLPRRTCHCPQRPPEASTTTVWRRSSGHPRRPRPKSRPAAHRSRWRSSMQRGPSFRSRPLAPGRSHWSPAGSASLSWPTCFAGGFLVRSRRRGTGRPERDPNGDDKVYDPHTWPFALGTPGIQPDADMSRCS